MKTSTVLIIQLVIYAWEEGFNVKYLKEKAYEECR